MVGDCDRYGSHAKIDNPPVHGIGCQLRLGILLYALGLQVLSLASHPESFGLSGPGATTAG